MQSWEYMESSIALKEANKALQEWSEKISTNSLVRVWFDDEMGNYCDEYDSLRVGLLL
jgi:hypothetical protein